MQMKGILRTPRDSVIFDKKGTLELHEVEQLWKQLQEGHFGTFPNEYLKLEQEQLEDSPLIFADSTDILSVDMLQLPSKERELVQELDLMRELVHREEQELDRLHQRERELEEDLFLIHEPEPDQYMRREQRRDLVAASVLDLSMLYKQEKEQTSEFALDLSTFQEKEQISVPMVNPLLMREQKKEMSQVQKQVKLHMRELSRWQRQELEIEKELARLRSGSRNHEQGQELKLGWDLNQMQDDVRFEAKSLPQEQKRQPIKGSKFADRFSSQHSLLNMADTVTSVLIALLPDSVSQNDREGMVSVIYEASQAEYEREGVWRFCQMAGSEMASLFGFVVYSWVLVLLSYYSRLRKWFSLL